MKSVVGHHHQAEPLINVQTDSGASFDKHRKWHRTSPRPRNSG